MVVFRRQARRRIQVEKSTCRPAASNPRPYLKKPGLRHWRCPLSIHYNAEIYFICKIALAVVSLINSSLLVIRQSFPLSCPSVLCSSFFTLPIFFYVFFPSYLSLFFWYFFLSLVLSLWFSLHFLSRLFLFPSYFSLTIFVFVSLWLLPSALNFLSIYFFLLIFFILPLSLCIFLSPSLWFPSALPLFLLFYFPCCLLFCPFAFLSIIIYLFISFPVGLSSLTPHPSVSFTLLSSRHITHILQQHPYGFTLKYRNKSCML